MPFYENGSIFPSTSETVTLRVITKKEENIDIVKIHYAWLEIPIFNKKYIFLDLNGNYLSYHHKNFTNQEIQEIKKWKKLVTKNRPSCIDESLEGSIFMHKKLKNIDQVTWDWIPKEPHPILLEGNSGFGFFLPNMFNMLYSD